MHLVKHMTLFSRFERARAWEALAHSFFRNVDPEDPLEAFYTGIIFEDFNTGRTYEVLGGNWKAILSSKKRFESRKRRQMACGQSLNDKSKNAIGRTTLRNRCSLDSHLDLRHCVRE